MAIVQDKIAVEICKDIVASGKTMWNWLQSVRK